MPRQSLPSASAPPNDSSTPPNIPSRAGVSGDQNRDLILDAGATTTVAPAIDAPSKNAPSVNARGLAGAALLVMFFFVLSRVTGLLREVTIGNQFGTSAEYDAYLAAFRIPDILFQLVAGGALGSAFIPTFTQYWARGAPTNSPTNPSTNPSADSPANLPTVGQDQLQLHNQAYANAAWQLFSRTLNLVVLILVVLAAVAAVLAKPLVVWVIAPGFDPAQQELTASLMRGMLISTVIFGASGLIMGALNALQHFLLPAAAPVLYNLSIILGAWILGPRLGVYALVVGAVCGSLAHLLVQIPGLWRLHARYTLELSLADPGVREVMRLMGPRVLGLMFVQLQFLVNTIVASHLQTGSLSALNYAWLLMLLPLGIFAQAIATVIFPTFATQVATGRQEAMSASFSWILRLVIFLTLPAAVGLWVLDVPLVQMLFEHGKFDPHSTDMVAFTLRFFALGLLSHAIVEIGVRVFFALHDTWTPVVIGVMAMLIDITLSILLSAPLQQGGLALATSIATTVEMLVLLTVLNRRMHWFDGAPLAKSLGRDIAAAALMALVVWAGVRWIQGFTELGAAASVWLQALGGIALAALSYGVFTLLLGSPEARWLVNLVLPSRSE